MSRSHRSRKLRSRFKRRPQAEEHRALLPDPTAHPTTTRVMAYGPNELIEKESPSLKDITDLMAQYPVVWLDIAGMQDIKFIEQVGQTFSIHPLIMEDIVRTHQRSKMEDYPDSLFIVARMAPQPEQDFTEQISLFLKKNLVISFQEFTGDDLNGVRNRIRMKRGRIRNEQADYLVYAILDAAIDAYFPLVDSYGEQVEDLEDRLVIAPTRNLLREIYMVRRKLLELRRALWPHREMLSALYRGDCPLMRESTQVFVRDCYDHTVQLIDIMENYRELASNLMEVYLSSVSNRMNEIMKVLTIVSTIFIPLTFIVGVYGMNFDTNAGPWSMPELKARYGYPICMGLMLVIAMAQLYYFKRKGWLSSDEPDTVDINNPDTNQR